jgi:hypothetical protein
MKRREAKFVHESQRLSPDQIAATPSLRETPPRPIARRAAAKAARTPSRGGRVRKP